MHLNRQIILLFFLSSIVNRQSSIVKVGMVPAVQVQGSRSTGPKVQRSKGPKVKPGTKTKPARRIHAGTRDHNRNQAQRYIYKECSSPTKNR